MGGKESIRKGMPMKGPYKSPLKKLVSFFSNSRDLWKAKCKQAKMALKLLKNRVRFLERSKAQLKIQVKELSDELARLKASPPSEVAKLVSSKNILMRQSST